MRPATCCRRSPNHRKPHVRFIFGAVGIPWAAFTGASLPQHLGTADEDYQKYFNYFSNDRSSPAEQSRKITGKPALFADQQLGEVPGRQAA
jgi:hypothetical protein